MTRIPEYAMVVANTIIASTLRLFGKDSFKIAHDAVLSCPRAGAAQTFAFALTSHFMSVGEHLDNTDALGVGITMVNISQRMMPCIYDLLGDFNDDEIIAMTGFSTTYSLEEGKSLVGKLWTDSNAFDIASQVQDWHSEVYADLMPNGLNAVIDVVGLAMKITESGKYEFAVETEWDNDLNACIAGWTREGCRLYFY